MDHSYWQPSASHAERKLRAQVYRQIRAFFDERNVLEVDTPILSRSASTDPELTHLLCHSERTSRYLQTSPEFAMKRLLASGSGSIYQICRCFRALEQGRYHSPEFVMLEWYRQSFVIQALIDEVIDLLNTWWPDRKPIIYRYRELLKERTGLDYDLSPLDDFKDYLNQKSGFISSSLLQGNRDELCDLIFGTDIAPTLGHDAVAVLTAYPPSQAQFAKLNNNGEEALRFEVYIDGIEIANAYEELLDSTLQNQRFQDQNARREALDKPQVVIDQHLLSAMNHGLPQCSGVALGLDRLIMLLATKERISEVIEFPFDRA